MRYSLYECSVQRLCDELIRGQYQHVCSVNVFILKDDCVEVLIHLLSMKADGRASLRQRVVSLSSQRKKNTTLTIRERDAAAARGRLAGGGSKGGCTSNATAEILKSARKNGERP